MGIGNWKSNWKDFLSLKERKICPVCVNVKFTWLWDKVWRCFSWKMESVVKASAKKCCSKRGITQRVLLRPVSEKEEEEEEEGLRESRIDLQVASYCIRNILPLYIYIPRAECRVRLVLLLLFTWFAFRFDWCFFIRIEWMTCRCIFGRPKWIRAILSRGICYHWSLCCRVTCSWCRGCGCCCCCNYCCCCCCSSRCCCCCRCCDCCCLYFVCTVLWFTATRTCDTGNSISGFSKRFSWCRKCCICNTH